MEISDKAAAVSRMQRYIESHLDEEIMLGDLAWVRYSRRAPSRHLQASIRS
jgi:hypothetical protein